MPILQSTVAKIFARKLPFVQNILHGFGGTQSTLVQTIKPERSFGRANIGDFFDPKVFG